MTPEQHQHPFSYQHSYHDQEQQAFSNQPQPLNSQQYFVVSYSKKTKPENSNPKPSQEARVFVPQLVIFYDLMPELKDEQVCSRVCYFGKYGKIEKAVGYQRQNDKLKKKQLFAFITYSCQLEAALAVVALQNFEHKPFECVCNFTTSRFCKYVLRGKICTNEKCPYLHETQRKYTIINSGAIVNLDQSLKLAKSLMVENLSYFIQKEYNQFLQKRKPTYQASLIKCHCPQRIKNGRRNLIEFPPISQAFKTLISQGLLKQETYDSAKKEFKQKINKKQAKTAARSIEKMNEKVEEDRPKAISCREKDDPYILKRYLNPSLVDQVMNPQSKQEQYFKIRENDLENQRYYPRIQQPGDTPKKSYDIKTINTIRMTHIKILQDYHNGRHQISRFAFADPKPCKSQKMKIKRIVDHFLIIQQ